jgi:hypothetical protein
VFNLKSTNIALVSVNVTTGNWTGRGVASVERLSSVLYRVTLEDDVGLLSEIAVFGVDGYTLFAPGVLDLSLSSSRDFSAYVARTLLPAVGVTGSASPTPPAAQADWFINALTGSDSAAGSAAAPLRTLGEWHRRVGEGPIVVDMVVTLQTDITEDLNLLNLQFGPNLVQPFLPITVAGSVTIQGSTPVVLRSGTFTAVQLEVPGPGFPVDATITDAALPGVSWSDSGPAGSSLVDRRIVLIDRPVTSGFQPFGWVALDQGAKVARHSPFLDFATFAQTPPLVGERYEVQQLTRWTGSIHYAGNGGAGFSGSLSLLSLELVTDINNALLTVTEGVLFPVGCSCAGFEVVNYARQMSPIGCFFDSLTRVRANAGTLTLDACLLKLVLEVGGALVDFGVESMFQGGLGLTAFAGSDVRTQVGESVSFFDMPVGITVQPDGQVDLQGIAWGTGVTGPTTIGIRINALGSVLFNPAALPNIQTPATEVDVGGTPSTYALLGVGVVNATNHAIITQRVF